MSDIDLGAALDRIAEIIGSDKDNKLAEALDSKPSSLATWRSRNHIPYKHIVEFCLKRGIPVENILLGKVRKGEVIYATVEDALNSVLSVQSKMGLVFTAEQLKAVLGYAFKSQSDTDQLIDFIEAAFAIANKKPPKAEQE